MTPTETAWNMLSAPELAMIIRAGGEIAVPSWLPRRYGRMIEAREEMRSARKERKAPAPPPPHEPVKPPIRFVEVNARGNSRLDRATVLRIRELYAANGPGRGEGRVTMDKLAKQFGMSIGQVFNIIRGKQWQEVA